ncbi:MAG: transcription antitermination factor NusB [Clostridiales bacterium]|jgi:N utilization substance protein B|nr:transcription antitermination factor NusB [Clostridiales bacterium]
MSRKIAREIALKLLFSDMMGGENDYTSAAEQSGIQSGPSREDLKFSQEIIVGVRAHTASMDEIIARHAIGWSLDRMPKLDLCILRIALYEMLYRADIPQSVSINEAVELAKRYSGDKSPSFINGILGTVAKTPEDGASVPDDTPADDTPADTPTDTRPCDEDGIQYTSAGQARQTGNR